MHCWLADRITCITDVSFRYASRP